MIITKTLILTIAPCVLLYLGPTYAIAGQTTLDDELLTAEEAEPLTLDAGHIKLTIYISRTATLFHIVDQLSAWDEATHAQYRRYFKRVYGPFCERDRELLARHAAVRRNRGWGGGLEQTFYMPLDLESAIKIGVEQGYLTPEQATTEREVITHFTPRIQEIMRKEEKTVLAFRQRLVGELEQLRSFSKQISRFGHGVKPTVPVYLMVNPADRDLGGGYNGGRLTVEIPRAYDATPTFLHELTHVFLSTQRTRIAGAVNRSEDAEDLTPAIVEEGIAYALSPGIIHAESNGSDPLLRSVVGDVMAGKTLQDGGYPRDRRYGLALRPLLRQALQDETQTLESFLPRALDAWRVIRETDPALRRVLPKISPEAMPATGHLTISKAYWFHSKERPKSISEDEVGKGKDGHILFHVEEWADNALQTLFRRFYYVVDRNFVLKAEGHPDVKAIAERGWWGQEFHLRIPEQEYKKMVHSVVYTLQPVNSVLWKVKQGVTITKNE